MFKHLDFTPYPGLASPHLQMCVSYFTPPGTPPPSSSELIPLSDGDQLCCEISTPLHWQEHHKTLVLVHGLGGSHASPYMIRLARKFYAHNYRVVRINLRGCGTGVGLNKRPYNSGNSDDIYEVLQTLKTKTPLSPIFLIGFSLGGNLILKMAGELGEEANKFVDRLFAICPVLDIAHSVNSFSLKKNWIYNRYFLIKMYEQGKPWIGEKKIASFMEFDEKITAPLWGYSNANDFYEKCSSKRFISEIKAPCDLLLTADDPFIDYTVIKNAKLSSSTSVWLTTKGSHMGFIGQDQQLKSYFWIDRWLLKMNSGV